MAGASLFTLLDDIATLLDDIAAMTKVAARKTAGVLGDDLALNAQQVSGVKADRELPVVWAVCKGSLVNKLILVPAALLISAVAPWLITPLLMMGGAFLCYEGFEKVFHKLLHSKEERQAHDQALLEAVTAKTDAELLLMEKDKIKGAIRTDFILSAEIIVIALGTVAAATFGVRVAVLAGIALLMTVGVYGLVAGIVKIDDVGLYLTRKTNAVARSVGQGLLRLAPWLMKFLMVVGTLAMFLVGGGILAHGVHAIQAWFDGLSKAAAVVSPILGPVVSVVLPGVLGLVGGGVIGGCHCGRSEGLGGTSLMTPALLPVEVPPAGTLPAQALGRVFARYLPLLDSDPPELHGFKAECQGPHLARLCREAIENGHQYPFDKMNRWLGFTQGVLAAAGLVDVNVEREATRPLLHSLHSHDIPSWS